MRKQPIFKNYASGVLPLEMLLFSEGRKKPKPPKARDLGQKYGSPGFSEIEKREAPNACFQCKIKKISSFTRSLVSVFGLSMPLLLASISLILDIICRVFMAV